MSVIIVLLLSRLYSLRKALMYTPWLIEIQPFSHLIYMLSMMSDSSKSFILKWFFNCHLIFSIVFTFLMKSNKSSTYREIITLISKLINTQLSALIDLKLISVSTNLNHLFQIYSDCFRSYKLLQSFHTDELQE